MNTCMICAFSLKEVKKRIQLYVFLWTPKCSRKLLNRPNILEELFKKIWKFDVTCLKILRLESRNLIDM